MQWLWDARCLYPCLRRTPIRNWFFSEIRNYRRREVILMAQNHLPLIIFHFNACVYLRIQLTPLFQALKVLFLKHVWGNDVKFFSTCFALVIAGHNACFLINSFYSGWSGRLGFTSQMPFNWTDEDKLIGDYGNRTAHEAWVNWRW